MGELQDEFRKELTKKTRENKQTNESSYESLSHENGNFGQNSFNILTSNK